jgi:hypothetical protein
MAAQSQPKQEVSENPISTNKWGAGRVAIPGNQETIGRRIAVDSLPEK